MELGKRRQPPSRSRTCNQWWPGAHRPGHCMSGVAFRASRETSSRSSQQERFAGAEERCCSTKARNQARPSTSPVVSDLLHAKGSSPVNRLPLAKNKVTRQLQALRRLRALSGTLAFFGRRETRPPAYQLRHGGQQYSGERAHWNRHLVRWQYMMGPLPSHYVVCV